VQRAREPGADAYGKRALTSTKPLEINDSTFDESPFSIAMANFSSELIREKHNDNDVLGGGRDFNSISLMY
jgi:hypothetical protein